uniref:uncharacterized protein LOC120341307 isoform X1 n=1 Tax=Styela clava TaxID=7725 RepID=UPI00193932E5|nr:uncharacterized protein LOC120341307 isoform X1 [Styela clava]
MDFVKIILFISLIYGLYAKQKVPAGACVSKIVNGKLVQVGDCEKNDGSDIVRLIKKSRDEKIKAENKCDVTYKKKCYRAIVYDVQNVTFTDAEAICKSKNGKPANIYDLKHYQLLLPYLRSLILASGRTWINIWTVMEYKNNQLLLSNGIPITIATEVWYPNFPISDTFRTNVGVRIRKYLESANQGMFNDPPSSSFHGVICEI